MTTYGDMVFSTKLKTLMKRHRLSQTDVAGRVDVSQSLVSLWVQGKSVPAMYEAAKLAKLFDVDLGYLADDAKDEPPAPELSEAERAAIDLMRALKLGKDEALFRLATAPPGSVRRDVPKPGPLNPEPYYPPSGPEVPGQHRPAPEIPRKRRPG